MRREENRMMREEEEQRLRSENIEVKIILQNNDDNRFD